MTLRKMFILACGFLLCGVIIGCGEDSSDPASAQESTTDVTVGATPVGSTTPGDTTGQSQTPAPTMAPTGQGMAVDIGASGTQAFASCPTEATFTGQVQAMNAEVPDGGVPVTEAYSTDYDAGLEAIIAEIPSMEGDAEVSYQVTGATVVATSFYSDRDNPSRNKTQFWIADGKGSVQVRLPYDDSDAEFPSFDLSVGQKISFSATKLTRDAYGPKISSGENFTLDEVNQPVFIWEPSGALTESDVGKLARITGTINGSPESCGGSASCWPVSFGDATITLRSTTEFPPASGACLTFVGPVGVFQSNIQLDTINFGWLYIYD